MDGYKRARILVEINPSLSLEIAYCVSVGLPAASGRGVAFVYLNALGHAGQNVCAALAVGEEHWPDRWDCQAIEHCFDSVVEGHLNLQLLSAFDLVLIMSFSLTSVRVWDPYLFLFCQTR